MSIPWKLKSLVFGIIASTGAYGLLYFLQKHVTKRSHEEIKSVNENWLIHQNNLQSLRLPSVIEFGAGKSLAQNIYMSTIAGRQVVVDLFPMLDFGLFDNAAKQLSKIIPQIRYIACNNMDDLRGYYNINYIAPLDMRATGFGDNEFDSCISTNTLEHIPESDIVGIFMELKRVLKPNGLVSAVIDYSDHYSHTDKNIHKLNFLKFSEKEFSVHNYEVHYQNRLRHYDYVRIFVAQGFEIIKSEALNFVGLPESVAPVFDLGNPTLPASKGVFLLRNLK